MLPALVRLISDRVSNPNHGGNKFCLLLGAGADIGSGGLSFTELKRKSIEQYLGKPLFNLTQDSDVDRYFDNLFRKLPSDERSLLIEQLFRRERDISPSDAYKILVLLAEVGGINAIITTNFDTMLESAQTELGRDVFQIFAPGVARPYKVSQTNIQLTKVPYIKLHGDIASRSVTILTAGEIENPKYDKSTKDLLGSILRTHDLIIAGYSGYDVALAKLIGREINLPTNRCFWCNPRPPESEAPLRQILGDEVREVPTTFDNLIFSIGCPILERPTLSWMQPTYIERLFDWRVDYCNRSYIKNFGERAGLPMVDTLARRTQVEKKISDFLQPNRPLAIITGPSGFGKSAVGLRLHKTSTLDETKKIFLLRAQTFSDNVDIEQHILEQLGGLGSPHSTSLFELERWLNERNTQFVVYVDGLNEFSPDLGRCIALFRSILRFCYFLPEADSSIRMIVTIRQETWNAILQHVDIGQLGSTAWSPNGPDSVFETIACNELTNEELDDAIGRMADHGYNSIDLNDFSVSAQKQLHDPYILGLVAEHSGKTLPDRLDAAFLQEAIEAKLLRNGSILDPSILRTVLAQLAFKCLESPQERFRLVDVGLTINRTEFIRLMKDQDILADAGSGFLRFKHDRMLEYFLAIAISSSVELGLETLADLSLFLVNFKSQAKVISAARLVFKLNPNARFQLLVNALDVFGPSISRFPKTEKENLFKFARDVLLELAEQGEPYVIQYLSEVINADDTNQIGELHMRTVVQIASIFPIKQSIPMLADASQKHSAQACTEATIFATDKLIEEYLGSSCPEINFLTQEPYATFFADPKVTQWRLVGRILWLATQLGQDNSHPDEYASFSKMARQSLWELFGQTKWDDSVIDEVSDFILDNCDRVVFNATPMSIQRIFDNSQRSGFLEILERLADGNCLNEDDFSFLGPYIQSLEFESEYHISHALVILSSFNGLEETLLVIERMFSKCSNNTSPVLVDFLQACVVYIHVIQNLEYDENRFAVWEETILQSWPDVLLFRPGVDRGIRRGFSDTFDRIFEDGFQVIYPYGVLKPSQNRQSMLNNDYLNHATTKQNYSLPMYSQFLEKFLEENRLEEALQILHTLSSTIVSWPIEGLRSIRTAIGHKDHRIRRATIRVLAEAYNRHPTETTRFLNTSGAAVSDDDLIEIKIRQDPRVGRRQISEEEWGRIGQLLLKTPQGPSVFTDCLRSILNAPSFRDAIYNVIQTLAKLVVDKR